MKNIKNFLVTILTICILICSINMNGLAADVGGNDPVITKSITPVSGCDSSDNNNTVSNNDQSVGIEQSQRMIFRIARHSLPEYSEVTDLRLLSVVDGTPAFDADNAPGHDSSADNGILRTLDVVTYNLRMAIQVPETPVRQGETDKVMIKAMIPGVKKGEVQFLTDSMKWLYEPEVTETTEGLTLIGYAMMDTTQEGVYWQDMAFSVKAFAMEQGRKFAPQFSVWVEGQTNPAVITEGTEVTVSAKESLNVSLLFSEDGKRGTFDFSKDPSKKEEMYGYIFGLSIRTELKADGNSLKGVLLPKGDISFDINLCVWDNTDATAGNVDATQLHLPRVWDYTQSRTGDEKFGEMGRILEGKANGVSVIPYGEYNSQYPDRCVYDSGELTVVQEGNVLHVTIRNYNFGETVVFPRKTQNGNTFSANSGVFSSGLIQLMIPFENKPDSLLYTLEANISDVKMDGQKKEQSTVADDKATRNMQTVQGSWNQILLISHLDEFVDASSYVDIGTRGLNGRTYGNCYAYPGEKLILTGTFGIGWEEGDSGWNGTDYLMKVPRIIELPDIEDIRVYFSTMNRVNGVFPKSDNLFRDIKIRYAAKKDGTAWTSEREQDEAFITDLVYYDSKEEAADAGAEILGLLFECRSGKVAVDKFRMMYIVPVTVSESAEVGYVYPMTYECSQYAFDVSETEKGLTTQHGVAHISGINLDLLNTRIKSSFDSVNNIYGKNGDNSLSYRYYLPVINDYGSYYTMPYGYVKSVYDKGQVKAGTHVSKIYSGSTAQGFLGGNSLLIVDTQASITKSVEQLGADGNPRRIFNLNENQRVVDYILKPDYRFPVEYQLTEETDTLTITDTLDKGLTYITGSSFQGGEYNTVTEDLTGGIPLEPSVKKDSSGRQVLTWILENVKSGENIAPIHYSCSIDAGVKDGTQLSNTVKITAPGDSRPVSTDSGKVCVTSIQVIQSKGAILTKSVNKEYVELVDEIEYNISFTNHSNDTYEDILIRDILPFEGDQRNTDLKDGSYEVTGIEFEGAADGKMYVTMSGGEEIPSIKNMYDDPAYATGNMDMTQYWKNWEEITPQTDLKKITAVIFRGNVQSGHTLQIKVRMKVNFLKTKSVLYNNAEVYTEDHQQLKSVTVRTIALPQKISGIAWLDRDGNGIREKEETMLPGIKVSLMNDKEGPAKDVWGSTVSSTVTDSNGAYSFDNLPQGKYQVIFESGSYNISAMKVSPIETLGSEKNTDCNATANYESNNLQSAKITNIILPYLRDIMEEDLDVLETGHLDLGLYGPSQYRITVNYLEKGTDRILSEAYISEDILEDTSYDVISKSKVTLEGYTFDCITGDALKGVMNGNKVINIYFTKNVTVSQPESDGTGNSQTDQKLDSSGSDAVINDQENVPMYSGTEIASNLIIIDDPIVPLADAPKTGDNTPLYEVGAGCIGAGIFLTLLLNKKRNNYKA